MKALNQIIGFTVYVDLPECPINKQAGTLGAVLKYFPWLNRLSLRIGHSQLDIWGHGQLTDRVHSLADGTLFVAVGSPHGDISWPKIESRLAKPTRPEDFELPWDGRVVLLRISPDGRHWTMWNDWVGSIPVFHAQIGQGRIASTLEPVVVAAAGYTPDDFFLPGLVSLLVNGHYLGDWTLFKGMKVVPPDCVAEWDDQGFRYKRLWTVKPSDERWDKGWDELVDEMYELSRHAISEVLKTQSSWILPLSGGLDSRLIAAVGAEMGIELRTYTYGPATWNETIYARQVAKALDLPWKRVDLGTDYLAKYTRMWADWFGSALHFHGMYQVPFLRFLDREPEGKILQGYLGDPLAGNHVKALTVVHKDNYRYRPLTSTDPRWSANEIRFLMKIPIRPALEEMANQLETEINVVDAAWFQKLMFLDFWNRQRLFIFYQPTMYDYWRGVATPYFNKEYAIFCLSLPRLALEGRRLQLEMLRRYYPQLATIGGTFNPMPLKLTKKWLIRAGIAKLLPKRLCIGPLREFNPTPNTLEPDCIRATGCTALWPIHEAWDVLSQWFNMDMIQRALHEAAHGDWQAINKCESIQAIALRMLARRDI